MVERERIDAFLAELKFDHQGLIPAVIQDQLTGRVLMLAYMNREAVVKTLETGQTHFYSRSRRELWHKGLTSGHFQQVKAVEVDCDRDTLLWQVEQTGVACHEGRWSCFRPAQPVNEASKISYDLETYPDIGDVLRDLATVIASRQAEMPEGSYTAYLFREGQDKILKKVGEEAAEVIIGAKNNSRAEIVYECADLFYHILVLLRHQGITLPEIAAELQKRR
ncbi:MAG: bifunctional phosphoribosyl-AMP cyclohydrolase/phosphoribosyl-ATP diphosphatase HisIE [Heliobacteriaceae bacterium]|nr:bifunctional phosphoribosyl-AMP cyclohydrolase/phosphoribosyl-ATP diphosphatase HisIE [Heliobacteriaceae bacterium]